MAVGVVVGLERVEVEHQQRERPRRARRAVVSSRWKAPWLRRPVSASCSAWVTTAPCASALRSAIDAWPANSWTSSNSSWLKCASSLAHPGDVERADDLARPRAAGRRSSTPAPRACPGIWIDRGSRCASLARTASPLPDDPAGDAGVERPLVLEDHVGEPVAGDDGPADPRGPVDAVDRQRVVGDDGLERVGDHLEHAARVERREQPLVDLEQAALALEPVVGAPAAGGGPARTPRR